MICIIAYTGIIFFSRLEFNESDLYIEYVEQYKD